MTYLLYFTALSLSAVAAWYSIAGLAAIFAAAVIPIIIMGTVLEFSKLVVASWLYRSWKFVPVLMRTYFTIALIILMTLTSMGIFGFLSKAHLDQAVPTGDIVAKVEVIDQKIKTEKENVESARAQLKQLDAQVDQTMSRSSDAKGAERSLQIRRGQQNERTTLLTEIGSAQTRIARLNEERAPIAAELRKVEAEVGPVKYIAALIYGDNPDQSILEKAVRIVIIMIVSVFDPLAVLLLMAASMPIYKKEEVNDTEETSSPSEDSSQTTQNYIKERFLSKFKRRSEDSTRVEPVIDSGRDSDSPSDTDNQRDSSGSGETSSSEEVVTPVSQENGWTINDPSPSVGIKEIDYDSAGRRITPLTEEERLGKTIVQDVDSLQKR
jgi:hypothetical protein